MNSDIVLAALPYHKDRAMSMREIAEALGVSKSHKDRRRIEQRLARALKVLVKWNQVSYELKWKDNHFHNIYWKI